MAKLEMKGIDAYLKQLQNAAHGGPEICKAAVYAGAKVMADEIKKNIDGLKRVSDAEALAAYQKGEPTRISVSQKNGLRSGFGIAPIRTRSGYVETKLGFDGYNSVQTKKYPKGEPNVLIARICESGNSHILAQPFVRPAVNRSRKAALEAMAEAADKKTKELLGG